MRLLPWSDGGVALWLFVFSSLVYVSTATGYLVYGDDVSMLSVTQAFIEHRGVDVPPDTPGAKPGRDGRFYSKYGIGQSVLALPFLVVGLVLDQLDTQRALVDTPGWLRRGTPVLVVSLLAILSTAGAVALLYLTCRALELAAFGSLVAALSLGFGTFAWHYSRAFMTEPTGMVSALLAFFALIQFTRDRRASWLFLSGTAGALALLLRLANATLLVPMFLWLVLEVWHPINPQGRTELPKIALWLFPIGAAAGMTAAYNFVRFGSAFETGYGAEAAAFTTPLYVGLYGFLLSPGKSVFVYAPILVGGVVGWNDLRRLRPRVAYVIAAVVVAQLLFYARWHVWWGGGAWGPRFLAVVLPFMIVGVASLIQRGFGRVGWALLGLTAASSVFIQTVSVVVPYVPYQAQMGATAESFDRLLWHPAYSPVVAESRSFLQAEYPPDVAATRYHFPLIARIQVGAFLAAAVMLVLAVWTYVSASLAHPSDSLLLSARQRRQ